SRGRCHTRRRGRRHNRRRRRRHSRRRRRRRNRRRRRRHNRRRRRRHNRRRRRRHNRRRRRRRRCHGCPGHLRCGSLGLGRRTLLLATHRLVLCRRHAPRFRRRLIPHVPAILLYLTPDGSRINGEPQRSPRRPFPPL